MTRTRIIIDNHSDLPDHLAVSIVHAVMIDGRVSVAAGRGHYCWCTGFSMIHPLSRIDQNYQVITRHKKKNQMSDSFIVENVK